MVGAFKGDEAHLTAAVLQSEHLGGKSLGDGFAGIEDVFCQNGAGVGLGDVAEIRPFLHLIEPAGMAGDAALAGKHLLTESDIALGFQDRSDDFIRLERANKRRLVLAFFLKLEGHGGFSSSGSHGRVAVVHGGTDLVVETVEADGFDGFQNLHAAIRVLPAAGDVLLREFAGLRATALAGTEGEQRGVRPLGYCAVELGSLDF